MHVMKMSSKILLYIGLIVAPCVVHCASELSSVTERRILQTLHVGNEGMCAVQLLPNLVPQRPGTPGTPGAPSSPLWAKLPFHTAVARGKAMLVDSLLRRKANPNGEKDTPAPLRIAVLKENNAIVGSLLGAKACPEALSHDLKSDLPSPLVLAAQLGNVCIVEQLLLCNASVNGKPFKGKSPLRCAVEGGNLAIVSSLVSHRADPFAKDATGLSPLMAAKDKRNISATLFFLDQGVERMREDDAQIFFTHDESESVGRGTTFIIWHRAVWEHLLSYVVTRWSQKSKEVAEYVQEVQRDGISDENLVAYISLQHEQLLERKHVKTRLPNAQWIYKHVQMEHNRDAALSILFDIKKSAWDRLHEKPSVIHSKNDDIRAYD